ncbi:AAA family ATPase [Marinobacterium iners]|uniref:Predicted ATPase n=1 Tax=Marinobacterium iners DSM 11526 TaxID=1122198 RepID=A0A1H4HBS2_9GAMM|nr:AAA family ATPase [Marinobacterium iners]SEB19145.1 Predicted ATPase [Marinobacterium iners DSM 11526]
MKSFDAPQFIHSAKLIREKVESFERFPFTLPVLKNLNSIEFHPKISFFIGENGTGKSTLLEALAVSCGFNAEGGTKNFTFSTRKSHSQLWKFIRLSRSFKKPKDGFFLRAECFYNVATEIERLDEGPGGPPIINSYGGVSLHEQSHGESFFALMINRFGGNGLYILDEPEAALSPTRQMAMLSRMHQLVKDGSQFIIATHSPILMAYPDSKIFSLDNGVVEEIEYEESEHYTVTRHFLNNHSSMVSQLIAD